MAWGWGGRMTIPCSFCTCVSICCPNNCNRCPDPSSLTQSQPVILPLGKYWHFIVDIFHVHYDLGKVKVQLIYLPGICSGEKAVIRKRSLDVDTTAQNYGVLLDSMAKYMTSLSCLFATNRSNLCNKQRVSALQEAISKANISR